MQCTWRANGDFECPDEQQMPTTCGANEHFVEENAATCEKKIGTSQGTVIVKVNGVAKMCIKSEGQMGIMPTKLGQHVVTYVPSQQKLSLEIGPNTAIRIYKHPDHKTLVTGFTNNKMKGSSVVAQVAPYYSSVKTPVSFTFVVAKYKAY